MLIELGVMQQRDQAVLEVTGGLSVTEVARLSAISPQAPTDGPASGGTTCWDRRSCRLMS